MRLSSFKAVMARDDETKAKGVKRLDWRALILQKKKTTGSVNTFSLFFFFEANHATGMKEGNGEEH